jgi:BirA family biotin operon repressor/biotin-[acetyl-CoA-carboxylase] ligase
MKILTFEKLKSTQTLALDLAKKGEKPFTVVLAKEQTSGYGRKKNFWYSPRGGLYFSVVLPPLKIENLEILNILSVFLLAKILKENFKLEPMVKLPNDLYLNGKKIAGVIIENVIEGEKVKFSVMGIGLNTNIVEFPKDLQEKATSLKIELAKEVDNRKILKEILKTLKNLLKPLF